MKDDIFRIDNSKKRAILYMEDLSPANKLKFEKGQVDFYDLDIRMFRGYRYTIERTYIQRGYSVVLIHNDKTRLLLFNKPY